MVGVESDTNVGAMLSLWWPGGSRGRGRADLTEGRVWHRESVFQIVGQEHTADVKPDSRTHAILSPPGGDGSSRGGNTGLRDGGFLFGAARFELWGRDTSVNSRLMRALTLRFLPMLGPRCISQNMPEGDALIRYHAVQPGW